MTFKNKDLVFQGDNGRDEFQREKVADQVISLLTSEIDVSPMVIDGDWGTGKTEFCHKLINKFKDSHLSHRLVYVDAFQADHADNPLMTILAEVMGLLPDSTKKAKFIEKAIPVARYAIKTASKAVVSHLLRENADKLTEGLDEQLQQAADSAIDATVLAVLKDHEKAKENLQALQNLLSELAKEHPIVIFIDELDRCRPDFSVQMLEVIKHTFDVDGVKFVLVTNTKQLRAAINHCYGPLVDAQRYLDKFLKFSFCLPETITSLGYSTEERLASEQHFINLINQSAALEDTDLTDHNNGIGSFTKALITQNRLSLREVETFVRHIEILQALSNSFASRKIFGYQLLYVFGVYVFCFNSDLENSIRTNKTDAKKVSDLLSSNTTSELESGNYHWYHADVIAVFLAQECTYNQTDYQLNTEDSKNWQDSFSTYFNRRIPAQGERFTPVLEAINILNLNK